ncbi:hypothetical protein TMO_c0459 (plasmid) [Tistrella mobilis KA081020-065]|uniref:Uncharacterized protein n=1 Tax=Tistrella mobilis (strain KA081020-065) TaxID=1110502 RepID=I3TWD1_TISMK|nr:hypothetical protein TMO_c0459 [Tistrella mobilis KA081020-065]
MSMRPGAVDRRFVTNPRTRKGCNRITNQNGAGICGFNPRTRKGCDLDAERVGTEHRGFNPRTRKGCDLPVKRFVSIFSVSIHAPARGATHTPAGWRGSPRFQSTHPQGVRRGTRGTPLGRHRVSIHAPARGATCRWRVIHRVEGVSIHAPARGATHPLLIS